MPMTSDEKIEKAQRLLTAHKRSKEVLEQEPATWELHPGTDIARNWAVITTAYSGLEQTLKYLIAEEQEHTISELVSANGKNPYRTHNLAFLFSRLEDTTQGVMREFYERYRSLHSYITIKDINSFLADISGPRGDGYERWRYTLIEDEPLPRNRPEALVAFWGIGVQIAQKTVWANWPVHMPDEMLAQEFCNRLEMLTADVAVERQNNLGEEYQDISGEIRTWLWKAGHPLNAFADVLWHFSRYGTHGVTDISDWFSNVLNRWMNSTLESPATAGLTMLRAFVVRAQGRMPDGASIRWNPGINRFEPVPWSLPTRFQNTPPPGATIIGDPSWAGIPLSTLWQVAMECGYRVMENRAFDDRGDRDLWYRTLEVLAEDGEDEKPVLTVWQKRHGYRDRFYLVEECPSDEIDQRMRYRIDVARSLGKTRQQRE